MLRSFQVLDFPFQSKELILGNGEKQRKKLFNAVDLSH